MISTNTAEDPVVLARDLVINIESIEILKKFSITINRSEIHAIVGEHGAGKTSLCLLLAGHLRPDTGTIYIGGQQLNDFTPTGALKMGVELVSQQTPLVETFSIADNLFINNRGIHKHPFVLKKSKIEYARAYLNSLDIDLDPEITVRELKQSDKVLVDIAKHLHVPPKLLILDEALQKLTTLNLSRVTDHLVKLKQQGTAILFVTHRIDDIYAFADKVTIIRNGENIMTDSIHKLEKINLIRLAYTQLAYSADSKVSRGDFVNLLKYNEAVLQKLPVNLLVIDREMRLKLVNEQARLFFGIRSSRFINASIEEFLTDENAELYSLIGPSFSERVGRTYFSVPVLRQGTTSWVNINVHPIFDESFLIGYSIIIHDVTEQEKLREKVEVSEKLASLGLLSAGVAHEINNPLEVITNELSFIRSMSETAETTPVFESIDEELDAIAHIVGNLVSFSKNEADTRSIVEINTLIASIVELLRREAVSRNIQLILEQFPQELECKVNRTEIKQVVLNLIKNGIEAMSEGGTLTVSTRLERSDEDERILISVKDTGPGIPADKLKDIFLPFYSSKQHSPEQDISNHLGLGLSLSYRLVTKNEGTITVRNRSSRGAEFRIKIPSTAPRSSG